MPPAPVSERTAPRAMVFPAPAPAPALGEVVPVVVFLLLQAVRATMQAASTTAAALRPNFRSPVPPMARNRTDLREAKVVSAKRAAGQAFLTESGLTETGRVRSSGAGASSDCQGGRHRAPGRRAGAVPGPA